MIHLNKEQVDNVIRLTKKYYATGDTDILVARNVADDLLISAESGYNLENICEVINSISMLAHYERLDNSQIYDALLALGYKVKTQHYSAGPVSNL